MAYQIACLYTFPDSDETDSKNSNGTCNGLIIKYDDNKFVLEFNKHNLCRTIPYFIHCLNNDKKYTLKLSNNSMIILDNDSIKCRIEHGGFYSEINIPIEYKDMLAAELSKYKCYNISKNYISLMDMTMWMTNHSNNILFTTFTMDHNDTDIFIIDDITNDEKEQFRKLSNGETIEVRKVIYKNDNGNIVQRFNGPQTFLNPICNYDVDEVIYALDNIIDVIDITRLPPDGKASKDDMRIGEMEKNVLLSHGSIDWFKEKFIE